MKVQTISTYEKPIQYKFGKISTHFIDPYENFTPPRITITHHKNVLLLFKAKPQDGRTKRIFRFFKLERNTCSSGLTLNLERRVVIVGSEAYQHAPSLFIFEDKEINKKIIVDAFHCGTSRMLEIYDFETLETIASTQITLLNEFWKFTVVLWKQRYVVDQNLRIMSLKNSKEGKFPYSIHWKGGVEDQYSKIFNLNDQYILAVHEYTQERYFLFQWNRVTESFDPNPQELDANKFPVPPASIGGKIAKLEFAICVHDKIIASFSRIQGKKNQVFVWSMEGVPLYQLEDDTFTNLVWNNWMGKTNQVIQRAFYNANNEQVCVVDGQSNQAFYSWNQFLVLVDKRSIKILGGKRIAKWKLSGTASIWSTQKLLWVAWMKNKGESPLSLLPREVLLIILSLLRAKPECLPEEKPTQLPQETTSRFEPMKYNFL